jgi:predicted dehydrogenase
MSEPKATANLSRRRFLHRVTGAASLLGFPTIIPATALGKAGKAPPSERILFGIIGAGNQSASALGYENDGRGQIVALADPNDNSLEIWRKDRLPGRKLREYTDLRELLASDVDAVHIATGDHWHVPSLLLAARAGKHAYVEKPLGVSIEQDLACREIVAEHPVQVQYGTQQRSQTYSRGPVEIVLNGHIGEVKEAYVFCPGGLSGGVCNPEPVPASMKDYDLWLGPAPAAPYCQDRCVPPPERHSRNGIFHIYDYALGFLAGWGAHPYDVLQWWLDKAGIGMPTTVEASGEIPAEGLFDTITKWDAKLSYPDGLTIHFCDWGTMTKRRLPQLKIEGLDEVPYNGVLFLGSEGWLVSSRETWKVSSRDILAKHKDPGAIRVVDSGGDHRANLLDAIQGKNKVAATLDSAIRSDICCHLVDLAVRYGGTLGWDAQNNTVTGNAAAKSAMRRPMRSPWNVLNPKYAS